MITLPAVRYACLTCLFLTATALSGCIGGTSEKIIDDLSAERVVDLGMPKDEVEEKIDTPNWVELSLVEWTVEDVDGFNLRLCNSTPPLPCHTNIASLADGNSLYLTPKGANNESRSYYAWIFFPRFNAFLQPVYIFFQEGGSSVAHVERIACDDTIQALTIAGLLLPKDSACQP